MGSLSDYAELELLDHVFNAAYSPVATLYLALATATITDSDTGATITEVPDSNNYARATIAFGSAASRIITQSGAVTFNQASGAWGTVTDWAILDSNTHGAGNMLAYGAFASGKSIVSGNTPSVADASITVTMSGEVSVYLANKLLDLMFKNTAYSKPDTYLALCVATLDENDTTLGADEVPNLYSYARKQVNINGGASPTWDLAAAGLVDNTHDIDFAAASGGSWGTVVALAICDSGTHNGGNMLFYDNDMSDQAVGDGDTAQFPAGDLDITLS